MSNRTQVFKDDGARWDPERFRIARSPLTVGRIDPEALNKAALPCALNMRVRNPNDDWFYLPAPYADEPNLLSMLQQSIRAEAQLNPDWRTYGSYLTVDHRLLPAMASHRGAGWHFESMQGEKYPQKLPACQFFTVATTAPTEFFTGAVDAHGLHESRDDWFRQLARQVEASIAEAATPEQRAAMFHIGRPGEIKAFSSYQLHRSPTMPHAGTRTFVRLEFTQKTLETEGDSRNPLLPGPALIPVHDPFHTTQARKRDFSGERYAEKHAHGIALRLLPNGQFETRIVGATLTPG